MPSAQPSYQALVTTQAELDSLAQRLDSDRLPVAIDAERASGYRYYQRAYLLQLNHPEHGTWLVDPIAIPKLEPLAHSLKDREWVIHAATQDLPCLTELGMRPNRLFDTELAGRLLGMPRVALAVMLEEFVGVKLAKQHSAADWSRRPLPDTWLEYAALDVAYLMALRERVAEALREQNKFAWAVQEFDSLCTFEQAPKKDEPWRRLSGVHSITNDRSRAVARSLWRAREDIARQTDTAPGRVLSDAAILAAAKTMPTSQADLEGLREFKTKVAQERITTWLEAIKQALSEPAEQLPPRHLAKGHATTESLPTQPPKINAKTDPAAAERLGAARQALREIGERVNIPAENLLPAVAVRAAVWLPTGGLGPEKLRRTLLEGGARQWQIELVSTELLEALKDPKLLTSRVRTDSENQQEGKSQKDNKDAKDSTNQTGTATDR